MKTKLAPIANQATSYWADIADTLPLDPGTRWEVLRDWLDTDTGGELDAKPLDILTDMLERRLRLLEA
jgi:hypothetical protein